MKTLSRHLLRFLPQNNVIINSQQQLRHYRAAVLRKFGEPLVIVDEPKQLQPHQDQLLIEVDSAGINHADVSTIQGKYHLKPALPFTPGFELAGTVKDVGANIKRFKTGDRVIALKTTGNGAFAQQCLCKENEVFPIPYTLDFEMAASLPVAYGSAYIALQKMATDRIGNSVLILTSQGTIGMAAIDLAQNVFKITEVFAASDSEQKCDVLRSMQVLSTINWTQDRLLKRIHKKTFNQGVDVVIDTVGGAVFHDALECIKPGGHVMSVGFSSGEIPTVSLLDLLRLRATISGIWLGGVVDDDPTKLQTIIDTIISWYDERFISPFIAAKFALDDINNAIEHINDKNSFGKSILVLRDGSKTEFIERAS